ncbi:MAG TPA: ATP-binding protein [Pyrinomonadaceae bacterium]|nr:ATP-binding protein [Pyrinomonadaceae bacterium]
MQKNIIEINLPSELESIDKAVAKATEFATDCGFSEEELFGVDLAVRESVTNAIKHGNKFDESKDVVISMENVEKTLIITVRDFGDGFAVDDVPDPTNPENLLKSTGRGILFMNNFMDEIEWINHSEGGTIVKMTKKH